MSIVGLFAYILDRKSIGVMIMATLLRLLIIAGIIWLVYSFIKRALNNSSQQLKEQQQTPLPTPMMQQCAHCGVHM